LNPLHIIEKSIETDADMS